MRIASIRCVDGAVKVLPLRLVMHSVMAASSDIVESSPVLLIINMLARRGERLQKLTFSLASSSFGKIFNWHACLLAKRNVVGFTLSRQFAEILGLLLHVDVNDARQMRRTGVPVRHLESDVRLSRLLAEVLTVEGMAVLVRFAVGHVPPVVPVLGS